MDFDRICMMFTMQEPFYGILLSSMNRVATERIPTMSVSRSGNVFQFNYNPKWIKQFNVNTILELIKHEVLHVAFNHFGIWDYRTEDPNEAKLRNISADLEINGYLNRDIMQKEAKGIFASDFGLDNFLGTREYYKIISQQMQQNRQQAQANNPQQPCNGGQGGQSPNQNSQPSNNQNNNQQNQQPGQNNNQSNGNSGSGQNQNENAPKDGQPQDSNGNNDYNADSEFLGKFEGFDDHSQWPEEAPDSSEAQQLQQMIDDLLDFAAEECEKNRGTIPAEMVGKIDNIRKKPRPVADWKRYFRRYLGNEFTELIRKSKKRESRRFPDAAGNRHRRKSHILVGIDTSGSVSMPEYREFFGQIKTLTQSATFHVVECDARVQHEYDFNGRIQDTLHGGGGTDFQPVVDIFNNNKRKYDALVYFTDGCAPIPHDTPKETLWVISSGGDHNRKKYKRNGASVVFIPNK